MDDSHDDRHLHLVGVEEGQLVVGHAPDLTVTTTTTTTTTCHQEDQRGSKRTDQVRESREPYRVYSKGVRICEDPRNHGIHGEEGGPRQHRGTEMGVRESKIANG